MRSIGHASRKANTNLRGRKTLTASCGCCTWVNHKEREEKKRHQREMRDSSLE